MVALGHVRRHESRRRGQRPRKRGKRLVYKAAKGRAFSNVGDVWTLLPTQNSVIAYAFFLSDDRLVHPHASKQFEVRLSVWSAASGCSCVSDCVGVCLATEY